MDQLSSDAHLVARPDHRTLDERVDAQFAGNLSSGLVSARVSHGRRMRDDTERTDLRQIGDQFVGHAICKKLLIRIARKIQQGKDGDGFYRRGGT